MKNMARNLVKYLAEPTFVQTRFSTFSWYNSDSSKHFKFEVIQPWITNDFSKNILLNELMMSARWQILGSPQSDSEGG